MIILNVYYYKSLLNSIRLFRNRNERFSFITINRFSFNFEIVSYKKSDKLQDDCRKQSNRKTTLLQYFSVFDVVTKQVI